MTKVKVYVKQDILVAVVVDTEDSSISSDYVLRPKEYLGLDGGQSYDQDFPEIYPVNDLNYKWSCMQVKPIARPSCSFELYRDPARQVVVRN